MQTLFGLPLFGSLFTPILITIVSVLLYKTFFSISKTDIHGDDIKIEPIKATYKVEREEIKPSIKKKKLCGKKGDKGCCSTKNGLIDITKVFVESSCSSKECSQLLENLWKKGGLDFEVISINSVDLENQLNQETGSVSLCVFLIDKNEENPILRPWLENLLKEIPINKEKLTGLKYSVFVTNGVEGDTIHQETDRALHKLGGVRVCKAGILNFAPWLENLSQTVSKWNQTGKKGCKCGPDSSDDNEEEHSSCSGNCSSSEDEAAPSPVLDLEDLGKALR